jgi:soluble lytic murein transglycosylase-like protein
MCPHEDRKFRLIFALFVLVMLLVSFLYGSWKLSQQESLPQKLSQQEQIQFVLETAYNQKWPRSELMAHSIVMASAAEGVDAGLLLAVMQVESTMFPRTNKHSGATGFMQVKPHMWQEECGHYLIKETYENIFAGACVLRHNLEQYRNVKEALLVYNIGRRNYLNGVLISEGNHYVQKVLLEASRASDAIDKVSEL